MIDKSRILELLQCKLSPDSSTSKSAQTNLSALEEMLGYTPTLLGIALEKDLDPNIRKAAALCLKDSVSGHWEYSSDRYTIHNLDKEDITDLFINFIHSCSQDQLAMELSPIVNTVINKNIIYDWFGLVDSIHYNLSPNNNKDSSIGPLVSFNYLVMINGCGESELSREVLKNLLPVSYKCLRQLVDTDPLGEQSCQLQWLILKVFFSMFEHRSPLDIVARDTFIEWMTLIIKIASRDVPEEVQTNVCLKERQELAWWKCKHQSLKILSHIFEHYGLRVREEHRPFAKWYIETFSSQVIQLIKKIFDDYALGHYVSSDVMELSLGYFDTAVLNDLTWKMIENDILAVVGKITIPIHCSLEEEEELWRTQPDNYNDCKFLLYFCSPATTFHDLLRSLCKKRKGMMDKIVAIIIALSSNPQTDPKLKHGSVNALYHNADFLMKNPTSREQLETILEAHIFPLFDCPQGYVGAQVCSLIGKLATLKFKNPNNIILLTKAVAEYILEDPELPLKIEAAHCLLKLLPRQETAREVIRPIARVLITKLIQVIPKVCSGWRLMDLVKEMVSLYRDDLFADIESIQNMCYAIINDPEQLKLAKEEATKLLRVTMIESEDRI